MIQVRLLGSADLAWVSRACRSSGFARPHESGSLDEFLWKQTVALWVLDFDGQPLMACFHDLDARHQLVQACFVQAGPEIAGELLHTAVDRIRATVPLRKVQAYVIEGSPEEGVLLTRGWRCEARLPKYLRVNGVVRDCAILAG